MKLAFIFSDAAVASALIACSSATSEPTDQTSSEDLSSTAVKCPPGEKVCEVATSAGICRNTCVPDNVMCVKPACHVCDPSGPAPRPVCHWDTTKCDWECPVCDPSGPAPQPGCKWDSKACVWLCL